MARASRWVRAKNVVGGQSVRGKAQRKGRDRNHTIWIHDGGAGVFKNIWSPDVWAKVGIYISDTEAPGKMYLVSVEHHLDIEVVLERVANWKIICPADRRGSGQRVCRLCAL